MENRRYPRYHLPATSCLPVVLEIGSTGAETAVFGMLINLSLSGLCMRSRNLVTERMHPGTDCFVEIECQGRKLQTFASLVRSEHINTQSIIALSFEPLPALRDAFSQFKPDLFALGAGAIVPVSDSSGQGVQLHVEGVFYHATVNEFLYYLASDRVTAVHLGNCTEISSEGEDVLQLCRSRGIPVHGRARAA